MAMPPAGWPPASYPYQQTDKGCRSVLHRTLSSPVWAGVAAIVGLLTWLGISPHSSDQPATGAPTMPSAPVPPASGSSRVTGPAAKGQSDTTISLPVPDGTRDSSDGQAPTDQAAIAKVDDFMRNISHRQYSQAYNLLCDAGKNRFKDGDTLRSELGLGSGTLVGYSIKSVEPETFNGDPRKAVTVELTVSGNSATSQIFSVTQEHNRATVCGFKTPLGAS
jgi:hypothetical protein